MRILLLLAALLAGCATHNQDGINALNRGDLSTAERLFSQGASQGDPMSLNNLGVVYERRGDRAMAISYYTLSARWGVPLAAQNLARLGAPVPSPDLAMARDQRNAAQSAATADFIRAINPPPRPLSPPTDVSCTSYRTANNTVQTTCR